MLSTSRVALSLFFEIVSFFDLEKAFMLLKATAKALARNRRSRFDKDVTR